MKRIQSVTVFCGSGSGARPEYTEHAHLFGRLLAEHGLRVVYGGGRTGLMGALADAVLEAGGSVVGVIPQHLVDREAAHEGVSELMIVDDMHQRKARLAALGDCFVSLPGGSGTLEEFFEAWTWRRLGLHAKPSALLNTLGYWNGLIAMLERMAVEQFMGEPDVRELVVEDAPETLMDRLVELGGDTSK
ncbi:MAG: TIGR00730 family Rossman fold protein [Spirochaetota bacterium]